MFGVRIYSLCHMFILLEERAGDFVEQVGTK